MPATVFTRRVGSGHGPSPRRQRAVPRGPSSPSPDRRSCGHQTTSTVVFTHSACRCDVVWLLILGVITGRTFWARTLTEPIRVPRGRHGHALPHCGHRDRRGRVRTAGRAWRSLPTWLACFGIGPAVSCGAAARRARRGSLPPPDIALAIALTSTALGTLPPIFSWRPAFGTTIVARPSSSTAPSVSSRAHHRDVAAVGTQPLGLSDHSPCSRGRIGCCRR